MPKNIVVIGPPGTGKTRLGIEISKGWFDAGAAPEEVAYLAFTKAAANVAASRIEEAGVEAGADGKFPYFRTIHSLAYRELKKKRDDVRVVNLADMKLFSAWSSFEGTFAVEEWEDLAEVYRRLKRDGRSEWDDCLTAYTLSRISCTKPTDIEASSTRMSSLAQRTFGRSINEDQYRIFVRKYEDYKRANGLIDFTDMLAFALCEMPPIDCVRHAVVDECLPAGTPVMMSDGTSKPIENVTSDDTVLGYDHSRGLRPSRVVETRSTTTTRLIRVNGVLRLTPNHPVYVPGKGYVEAGRLKIGDPFIGLRNLRTNGDSHGRSGLECEKEGKNDLFQKMRRHPSFKKEFVGPALSPMREGVSKMQIQPQKILFAGVFPIREEGEMGNIDLRDMRERGGSSADRDFAGADDLLDAMRRQEELKAHGHGEPDLRTLWERIYTKGEDTPKEVLFEGMLRPVPHGSVCEAMPNLRETDVGQKGSGSSKKVLLKSLCPRVGAIQAKKTEAPDLGGIHVFGLQTRENASEKVDSEKSEILQPKMRGSQQIHSRRPHAPIRPDENPKSDEGRERPCQGEGGAHCDWASSPLEGREWDFDRPTKTPSGKTGWTRVGMVSGVRHPGLRSAGLEEGDSGLGSSGIENRRGGGWGKPQHDEAEIDRHEERVRPTNPWLEGSSVQKRSRHGDMAGDLVLDQVRSIEELTVPSTRVYNIGTVTENYFADGILVHNCQDLAPVLHAIVERVFQGAEEIWWAGDVNQTIFSFAAADAKLFIKRAQEADHRVVLRQTHRFGQEVVDFSTRIIMRAQDRIVVDVKGLPGKMHVLRDTGSFRPMVRPMLILHRHVSGCKALAVKYIAAGMPFRNERGMDPLGADARIKAFTALYDLSEGKDVAAGNVGRLVDDLMPSMLQPEAGQKGIRLLVHGAKKKIQDGFLKGDVRLNDLIQAKIVTEAGANLIQSKTYRAFKHPDDLEYYHRVIQNGHSLHADKIPIITTIHGSKGREAPSVVVFSEMGSKCWDDQDSEHRLAYVAATRTQGELEICAERTVGWAKTKYDYPIEKAIKKQEIDFDA